MQSALGRMDFKGTVRAGSWDTSREALQGRQGCGDGLGRAKQRRWGGGTNSRDSEWLEGMGLRGKLGAMGRRSKKTSCLLLRGRCWCY